MNENDYLEIYDPKRKTYFPVRIVGFHEDGIICYFLENKSTNKIYQYTLDTYGYKRPWISEEILINCGLVQHNVSYIKDEKFVIKCVVGQIEEAKSPYLNEFRSKYFGYKLIDNKKDFVDFIEILKNTSVDVDIKEFSANFLTTEKIEDLREFLNFENENFDEVYLKSRSFI